MSKEKKEEKVSERGSSRKRKSNIMMILVLSLVSSAVCLEPQLMALKD